MQQSVNDGHIYLYQEVLLRETSELLGVQIQDMEQYLMDLAMEKDRYEAVGAGNEDIYVSLLLYGIKYSKNAA